VKKIIDIIVGARPNFMKVAALFAVAENFPSLELRLIHTGQHYDVEMSGVFFSELGLPAPVKHFGVGSKSHAIQTAEIMLAYEEWTDKQRPDICLVVGDVNSTVACALVASKKKILIVHVESGLRSFDRSMPEELNRIITDNLSDVLFVNEPSGVDNLIREGNSPDKVHLVGNVMIDTLLAQRVKAKKRKKYLEFGLEHKEYAFVTLHRPSNVDDNTELAKIVDQLLWLSDIMPVIFSLHPRTKKQLHKMKLYSLLEVVESIRLIGPLSYIDALSITDNAKVVITDSGGLQEETSVLGVPCLTLRNNTERPITITKGTNTLIKSDWGLFRRLISKIEEDEYLKDSVEIPFWDGQTGSRILKFLENI